MGQGLGGGSGGKGGACGSEVELGEIGELTGIWEKFWQKTESEYGSLVRWRQVLGKPEGWDLVR